MFVATVHLAGLSALRPVFLSDSYLLHHTTNSFYVNQRIHNRGGAEYKYW